MLVRLYRLLVLLILAVNFSSALAPSEARAQPREAHLQALTREVETILRASDTVGFSATLTDGQAILWSVEYGYLDQERGNAVSLDTPFRMGSVTKSITAIAILQLVEQGLVDLDDPVTKYVGSGLHTNAWAETHPVKVGHLLEHTTGWDDLHFVEYLDYPVAMSVEDGLAINPSSRVSRWPPGTVASYSNAGYAVAGRIIEIVTGMPYPRYVEKHVLSKLGLENSGFDLPLGDRLTSFQRSGVPFSFTDIWVEPAGGLAMSPRDLTSVTNTLMRGGGPLLSRESVARMESPATSITARHGLAAGWGPGLETRNRNGHLYRVHSGAIDGYSSEFGFLRTSGLGYVLLSNTADADTYREVSRAVRRVIEAQSDAVTARPLERLPEFADIDGAYTAATTRNGTFYLLDLLLGPMRLSTDDDALALTSYVFGDTITLHPLGDRVFTDDRGLSASHLLVGRNGDYALITPDGEVLRKSSSFKALAPIVLLALSVGSALIAAIVIISGSVVRLVRPFAMRSFLAVWLCLMLAGLTLIVFAGLLIAGLNNPVANMKSLGTLSPLSGALWATSFGLPLFAFLGLVLIVRARSAAMWVRVLVGFGLLAQASFALLMFCEGWVGFTTWSSDPGPYPIGDLLAGEDHRPLDPS